MSDVSQALDDVAREHDGWWPRIRDAILSRFEVTPKARSAYERAAAARDREFIERMGHVAISLGFSGVGLGYEKAILQAFEWVARHRGQEEGAAAVLACESHRPVQHRDGKPPWCNSCGLTAAGHQPSSRFDREETGR
ncbi:hypothetical protein [Microbacterium sp. KNMS]